MSFFSTMFLLFASLSTASADEYSNLDSDQYGLRVSMEEKGQVQGSSKHGFRMGYGYVNASEDHGLLQSNWLYLLGRTESNDMVEIGSMSYLFKTSLSLGSINHCSFHPTIS